MVREIVSVYADKGYDAKYIRNYLRDRNINLGIPFRKNNDEATKKISHTKNITRFVMYGEILCMAQVWILQELQ